MQADWLAADRLADWEHSTTRRILQKLRGLEFPAIHRRFQEIVDEEVARSCGFRVDGADYHRRPHVYWSTSDKPEAEEEAPTRESCRPEAGANELNLRILAEHKRRYSHCHPLLLSLSRLSIADSCVFRIELRDGGLSLSGMSLEVCEGEDAAGTGALCYFRQPNGYGHHEIWKSLLPVCATGDAEKAEEKLRNYCEAWKKAASDFQHESSEDLQAALRQDPLPAGASDLQAQYRQAAGQMALFALYMVNNELGSISWLIGPIPSAEPPPRCSSLVIYWPSSAPRLPMSSLIPLQLILSQNATSILKLSVESQRDRKLANGAFAAGHSVKRRIGEAMKLARALQTLVTPLGRKYERLSDKLMRGMKHARAVGFNMHLIAAAIHSSAKELIFLEKKEWWDTDPFPLSRCLMKLGDELQSLDNGPNFVWKFLTEKEVVVSGWIPSGERRVRPADDFYEDALLEVAANAKKHADPGNHAVTVTVTMVEVRRANDPQLMPAIVFQNACSRENAARILKAPGRPGLIPGEWCSWLDIQKQVVGGLFFIAQALETTRSGFLLARIDDPDDLPRFSVAIGLKGLALAGDN